MIANDGDATDDGPRRMMAMKSSEAVSEVGNKVNREITPSSLFPYVARQVGSTSKRKEGPKKEKQALSL
jgi:hypothetical protein